MVKAVERDVGRQMRGRGQFESALRRDAQIRIPAVQLLLLQRLDNAARGFAVKLGPERVISAAQKGGIGTCSRNLPHALTAKWKRQTNIVRHLARPLLQLAVLAEVIHHRADKWPMPRIAW